MTFIEKNAPDEENYIWKTHRQMIIINSFKLILTPNCPFIQTFKFKTYWGELFRKQHWCHTLTACNCSYIRNVTKQLCGSAKHGKRRLSLLFNFYKMYSQNLFYISLNMLPVVVSEGLLSREDVDK